MPAAILALASSVGGALVATAVTSPFWGAMLGGVAAAGIAWGGSKMLGLPAEARAVDLRGTTVSRCATDAAIPVVYGNRRIGILTVYMGPSDQLYAGWSFWRNASIPWNGYLHIIGVLCEGELAQAPTADDVYLGDTRLSDAKFSGLYRLKSHVGTDDQDADDDAVAEIQGWTYEHRLRGCAYIYLRLQYNQDVFGDGLDAITVQVSGRKIYDPRDQVWKQSSNPALCVRDYLLNTRFGYAAKQGITEDNLVAESFVTAANICDEDLEDYPGLPRFTCDGVVDTAQGPETNLNNMLTCCRGLLFRPGGKFRLVIDRAETATGFTFDRSNFGGSWSFSLGARDILLNQVRAEYFDNSGTKPGVRYRIVDSPEYRTLDNGLLLRSDIQLPFTTNPYRAKILAALTLLASRFPNRTEADAQPEGARIEGGDVVALTHETPGFEGKLFRVGGIELKGTHLVRVALVEYNEAAYDYAALIAGAIADDPDTGLFDPTDIGAPGAPVVSEATYSTREGRGVAAKAILSWEPSTSGYILHYVAEYKLATDSSWTVAGVTPAAGVEILDITPGNYEFRVKAVSSLGASSDYSGTTTKAIAGLLAPPATLTNLQAQASAGLLLLSWDPVEDLDVLIGGIIRVRHDPATSGATWDTGTDVLTVPGRACQAIAPLVAGTYMLKAIDSSGIESTSIASVYSSGPFPWLLTEVDSIQEDTTFTGTKTNCEVNGSSLRLTIDGNGDVASVGTYLFADSYSGAAVAVHRVVVTIDAAIVNEQNMFDSRTGLMDSWGNFDGDPAQAASADAKVYCRWKDASGDSFGSWQLVNGAGEFSGRYAEFKAELTSINPASNIYLSQLRVKLYTYD